MKPNKKIILIAGMGNSPQVLTETVWELAHLKRPLVTVGPVDELINLIVRTVRTAAEIGTQELLRTAFDKALEISQKKA